MQCNCIKEIEKNLAEQHVAQTGATARVECQGRVLAIDEDMSLRANVAIPFRIMSTAKGYLRGKTVSVHVNYCPYCGKKTREEVPA